MASNRMKRGVAANMQHTGQRAGAERHGGEKKQLVNCMDCVHAMLHRYGDNPVLAACRCKPNMNNERFPYQVEVARFMRYCSDHQRDVNEKVVEQRRKVA